MKNISFDNPYLLLVIIPLLLCIIVPILIAIRKENKSKSVFVSMVLHVIISACVVLALAGLIRSTVMTKTQIYVVADVSYSANRNLDKIDAYIEEVREKLPKNAEVGVVVFAKEAKVLVEMGGEPLSVKEHHGYKHDVISGTDISSALDFTAGLFDDDVIKRIVLITDGKETKLDAEGALVNAVENIYSNGIYLDAVYLDDNLSEDAREIQISDVQFADSTYKDHAATATLLIESSYDTDDVNLDFLVDSVLDSSMSLSLSKGYNIVNFDLPTSYAGRYDYRFVIRAKDQNDSTFNNTYEFTQEVVDGLHILLVSWDEADLARVTDMYGDTAEIDAYIKNPNVPCSVEELCRYDEIILSNFDVRDLNNVTAFIDGIDTVVSIFGKSLITMGDLRIQNKTDDALVQLEDMLPVKFGNNDQDPKLYTLVIDASRSMQNFSSLIIAKQAAVQLINMLEEKDWVTIVTFWGEISTIQTPIPVKDDEGRTALIEKINGIKPYQGTVIGKALEEARAQLETYQNQFSEIQIMLISDGMSYTLENDDPVEIVTGLYENGITTSVIHPTGREEGKPTLQAIAEAGGGSYFPIVRESELMDIMFSEVADELTDSVIHGETPVKLHREADDILDGIKVLPPVLGYTYARAKASATTVLTVDFRKSSGNTQEVPLYAYWNYGNGRVASFTSTLTGEWAELWLENENSDRFFDHMLRTNIPTEHIDCPFTVNVNYDSFRAEIEILPVNLNPSAIAEVTVTLPGEIRQDPVTLSFDSARYFYEFDITTTGKYTVDITYRFGGTTDAEEDDDIIDLDKPVVSTEKVFSERVTFNIPYSSEYNSFEVFDPAVLHAAVRNRGTVSEGVIPSLDNDDKEIATYTVRYIVPLMIMAAVLYMIDIMIRKLKWHDIKSFFGIKSGNGGRKS